MRHLLKKHAPLISETVHYYKGTSHITITHILHMPLCVCVFPIIVPHSHLYWFYVGFVNGIEITSVLCHAGYNAEKLPLGKLSKSTILKVSIYVTLNGYSFEYVYICNFE